jgi:excisionase family DNA binding protein
MERIYLTTTEASNLLRIKTTTLYKMTMKNTIPHYKCGGKVLFKTQELMDFVERCTKPTSNEDLDRFDLESPFPVAA